MSSNSSIAIAVTTGAAALCGGVFAWKLLSKYNSLESANGKNLSEIASAIDVDAAGGLLNSEDAKVRKSAELFLIDRVSSQGNLTYILRQCSCKDIDEVVKSVTVIYLLSQASDEMKKKLVNLKAINTLGNVIKKISNDLDYKYLISNVKNSIKIEKVFNCAMGSLFHLILRDSLTTLVFCSNELFIKNILLNIICDHGFHLSTDVKRWTTYMIHQIILCSDKHQHHIKNSMMTLGVINKVTTSLIISLGDVLLTHLCLQILVQYLNDTSNNINNICKEVILLGILPHLVGLLRCEEDDNVIQLSAIIIHHICCLDLEIKYLTSIPSMVNILFTVLNNTNATIQKTIIRICNYLCVGSSEFHKLLVENEPLVKRLSICLSSGNPEVLLGSLMLVHDLIMPGKEYACKIITMNPDILKALVKLSLSHTGETVQLIPETLGFICACESLHSLLLKNGVLNAILHFAKSCDAEVQFWASALLLNLSMISDEVKESIIRSGGLHILLEMAVSGDEHEMPDIATNATKTLVMMGFLDATMDVQLVSGLEGSIIIDGTEYCPGKQGINLIVFDFINYKFHKGRVIDTSELVGFFEKPEFLISDSVFLVTQGDCTISEIDAETMKKYFKDRCDEGNLSSPSWCWIYMPSESRIKFSEDNLEMTTKIEMKQLFGIVLEENFTDPLIDVILTIPASSNIDNLEELGLIEILARHYHQRKAIVSTANLLEYLFELIWRVSSLKPNEYEDENHKSKLSHSISALKIIHSCSNDKYALKELINRGLLQPLVSLLHSITVYCCTKESKIPTTRTKKISGIVTSLEDSPFVSDVKDESIAKDVQGSINRSINQSIYEEFPEEDHCDGSYLVDYVTNLSYSDDNIFQSELDSQAAAAAASSLPRPVSTVRFADVVSNNDFESPETNADITDDGFNTPTRLQSRNRTDSFIVRTDSQLRLNQNSMLQRRNSVEEEEEESTYEPSDERAGSGMSGRADRRSRGMSLSQTPSDPHQLRRISRSMSLSLQQAKYTEEYSPEKKFSNDTLNKMGKYIIMISYNMIQNADAKSIESMMNAHLLPFLYGYLGCIDGLYHDCITLAISSCFLRLSSIMSDSMEEPEREGVFVHHVDIPRSIVIRPDGLEVFNENWYFESVLANQPIGKQLYRNEGRIPAGWYYEVQILTDGVMQIGWANEACQFFPEKGCGVGDSIESCGYDGARKKIWNGPCRDVMRENDYGIEWESGDVISVLLSWDGFLNYWLNGKDMGMALSDVDTDKLWYPAVSIAISQHCIFSFKESSLRYQPPVNYTTITEVNTRFQTENQPAETDNEILQSLNDILIADCGILSDSTDAFLSFYYELDMHQLSEKSEITIGYTLFNNANSQHIDSNAIRIVKTLPATVLIDEEVTRLKIVGCGILSNMSFIVTLDGEKIFEKPLNDMSGKDFEFNGFFDTIPYVSNTLILVNFGQNEFTYNFANSSRYKFIDNLCRLQDIIENES